MMIINTSISYSHKNSFQLFKGLFNHETSPKIRRTYLDWAFTLYTICSYHPLQMDETFSNSTYKSTLAGWIPIGYWQSMSAQGCGELKHEITLQTKMVHNFQLDRKRIQFFYQFHISPKSPFWHCPQWGKKKKKKTLTN